MWIGVDGGGTNLRVVIVDDDMRPIASYHGERVNPTQLGAMSLKNASNMAFYPPCKMLTYARPKF